MVKLRDGWHPVIYITSVLIEDGIPVRAHTSGSNFDRAEDDINKWWGDPLEYGEWKPTSNEKIYFCKIY